MAFGIDNDHEPASTSPQWLPWRFPDTFILELEYETQPGETHFASSRRMDNYLSLVETSKEFNRLQTQEELWEEIIYSLMSRLGHHISAVYAPKFEDSLENSMFTAKNSVIKIYGNG